MTKVSIILMMLASAAAQLVGSEAFAANVSLRPVISVHGEMVRLSDLFIGLQPGQDCDIGPSPAPGKRIIIPSTQLAAIASEFGVDWQPGLAYQSAMLERLARIVTQGEVIAVLRPALIGNGAGPDSDISLASFVTPALPIDVTSPPEIQTLDFDGRTGRFSAVIIFTYPGSDGVTVRVVGRADQQIDVLTATHTLPAGALLLPADLQLLRIRVNALRGAPLTVAAEAEGLALKRSVAAG